MMAADALLHPAILLVTAGFSESKQIFIPFSPFQIGRSEQLDWTILVRDISRLHALIRFENERWQIVDANSTFGTFLNHRRLSPDTPYLLANGDEIRFGKTVVCTFSDPNETRFDAEGQQTVGLRIDLADHAVYIHNQKLEIDLSEKQFAFLKLLYLQGGALVTLAEIEQAIWPEGQFRPEMLDQLTKRLRANLASLDPGHNYIGVVRGVGRRFVQYRED